MSDIGFMKASSKNAHHYFYKTILIFPKRATSIPDYEILLDYIFKKTEFKKYLDDIFVKDIRRHHTFS